MNEKPGAAAPKKVEDRTAGLPKPDVQPSTVDVQEILELDVQNKVDEEKYPSRVFRRKKTIRLPIQKLEKYEAYCFLHKIDFQEAVEKALDGLTAGHLDVHVLIDDIDANKIDEVLIYYRKVTGNKVTKKDEEARAEARGYSVEACKVGIMMSLIRAKSKIHSFKYCLGAIEEVANSPVKDLQKHLEILELSYGGRKKDG